tara:strand:- start:3988 stop:5007 length:1020 start_codon:yes stop_codon:yes gene_type:complete
MASVNYQVTSNTKVLIATEATMGTPAVQSSAAVEMPVTEYSFSEIGAGGQTLEAAPFRVGTGGQTQSSNMVRAKRHDRMYEVSLTFHCTDLATKRVLLNLYEDGASGGISSLLGSMPTTTAFSDDVTNTKPVTIVIQNGGHSAPAGEAKDMVFTSAMCTSMNFSGDITSNAGVVMCTAVFTTGYIPTATTHVEHTVATALTAQSTMFNMHDISTSSYGAQDLVLHAFDLTIARAVNKISFQDGAAFKPYGYSIGPYEVTGSLTAKRDDLSLTAAAEGDTTKALDIDTSVYQILAPTCLNDTTVANLDEDGWKVSIPFRAVYAGATSSTIVSFAGAADDS